MIRKASTTTKEQAVVQEILEGIRGGHWALDSLLPSERALQQQIGVSRVTVRRALLRLARHAVIAPHQGVGSRVLRMPTPKEVQTILDEAGSAQPARVGRRIVAHRTYRLAFCDSSPDDWHTFRELNQGILAEAHARGHEVVRKPFLPDGADPPREFPETVYATDVDGLILRGKLLYSDVPNLARIALPYVLIASIPLDNTIDKDLMVVSEQALRALAQAGHRRIAVMEKLYQRGMPSLRQNICLAAASRIPGVRMTFLCGDDPFGQLGSGLAEITGFYVTDDVYAADVCRRLAATGRRLGCGVDLVTETETGFTPGLPPQVTRIEFDFVQMGSMAVARLEHMLDHGETHLPTLRISGRMIPGTPAEA